jgi:hypothetical protein
MNKIELSDQDAADFKTFMKYRDFFLSLIQAHTYGIKNGQAVFNFDRDGKISSVERRDCVYQRNI